MTAALPNSTPAPDAEAWWTNPPTPLPADAPQPWQDLWASVRFIHERAPETFLHAYRAGVDPRTLVMIQLTSPKDHHWPMPRMAFGGSPIAPERIVGPGGEVRA